MNAILIGILICWALGWGVYLVSSTAGLALASGLSSLLSYGWWVALLALAAYVIRRIVRPVGSEPEFERGDHVVYLKQKFTRSPGRRAEEVHPAEHGEGYSYTVRKPWTVAAVLDDQTLDLVTNGGKHHRVRKDDPRLHHAGPLEELMLRYRWRKTFPEVA